MLLNPHDIRLQDKNLTLRPMTESDWDRLMKWNNDPDVLYYSEGDDIAARSLEDVQAIYRYVSQSAFCFIMEIDNQSVGDCWLQQMNLERIIEKYPNTDCRRIDLMIGEKSLWGQGIGSRTIQLLVDFAFHQENADYVFGCDIADYNVASQKAFQKVGFLLDVTTEQPDGMKAKVCYDYRLSRADFKK